MLVSMVVPLVAVSVVTVPVTSRATSVVVMTPVTVMSIVMSPSIVPFPNIAMALLPLPTFPVAMAIVVPVAIPARINDDSGLDIYRSIGGNNCESDAIEFEVCQIELVKKAPLSASNS
jgi:hypothetical protein